MYIYGSFVNEVDETVAVHIVTGGSRTSSLEIGGDADALCFTDDPVEVSDEVNDTLDVLLRRSCSIRLLARHYMGELFQSSCRDAVVNVYKGAVCVFAGYIEPLAYSQPYNELYDEVELTCIDVASSLQYQKYGGVGSAGHSYSDVKSAYGQKTFLELLEAVLGADALSGIDIVGGHSVRLLYDGSKSLDGTAGNRYALLGQLSVCDLLFLGDEEDDTWTAQEVVEEVLRFLDLHLVQEGFDFHLFDWGSVRGGGTIAWVDLLGTDTVETAVGTVELSLDTVEGTDAQVSVDEVYNQLELTCDVEDLDTLVEDPLDGDFLVSPYTWMQKYCTEYMSDGEGESARKGFYAITHKGDYDYSYDSAKTVDWYVRVKNNPLWVFPQDGDESKNLVSELCKDNKFQHALPNWLGANRGAALLALGKVETTLNADDNSPTSKVDMKNYLVVSCLGDGTDPTSDETKDTPHPTESEVKGMCPVAVYTGRHAGGIFSPVDEQTTNYLVITGKLLLNALKGMTNSYLLLHGITSGPSSEEWGAALLVGGLQPSRTNGDGRWYTRRYWAANTPSSAATDAMTDTGLVPPGDDGAQLLPYNYSSEGSKTDTCSKVAVLACMLVIGDKVLVEKPLGEVVAGTDGIAGTGNGEIGDFVWVAFKEREDCVNDEEYYKQSFTIGIDPKIGDYLVGEEHSIQNNINYTLGIEVEGTAIPMRASDKLSGAVRFQILGPVNSVWNTITRRHPSFWRHTTWVTNNQYLLSKTSHIFVESLSIKIYSDNGLQDGNGEGDIVYMSDTDESYVNKKDDLEFKLCSALTSAECRAMGITNGVHLSTVLDTVTGLGLTGIYNAVTGESDKAEKHYVDAYWREYHVPRVLLEQRVRDEAWATPWTRYYHPALGKTFHVQGMGRNLMSGEATLMLKEV